MSKCEHNDFDEYFGVCVDCKATRQQVIAENIINELQGIYSKIQDALGIENGDIAPEQLIELEQAQDKLALVASTWLDKACDE